MLYKKLLVTLSRARYVFLRFYTTVSNSKDTQAPFRKSILPELVSKYGSERMIRQVFETRPELEQSDLHLWKSFTSAMHDFGFKFKDSLKIVSLSPNVLSIAKEEIEQVMCKWTICTQMNINKLKTLIINEPNFLHVEPEEIQKRVCFLKAYATSQEWLLTLLLLCPNIMFEKWSKVEEKINFLNYEVMVYRPEVLQCKALSKSIDHIKMRFLIIERCGLYIRPHPVDYKQTKAEIMKLNNPKLRDITDRSDTSFAKKTAKITLEEYRVFSEMFAFEHSQLSDSDDECD